MLSAHFRLTCVEFNPMNIDCDVTMAYAPPCLVEHITLSSQVCMEHSPGLITSWVTNQASVNLRKLKSYQASFLIMML